MLYAENVFIAKHPKTLAFFFNSIGSSVQFLQHVGFQNLHSPFKSYFKEMVEGLKLAKKLQRLDLPPRIVQSSGSVYGSHIRDSNDLIADLKPLLKALSVARRDEPEKKRSSLEVLTIRLSRPQFWQDDTWKRYGLEAEIMEAEVNKLVAEFME